jgi:acetyl-CoA acetyltransferase
MGEQSWQPGTWTPGLCSIAGIGATEFSKCSGRSVLALATEASRAAMADAGLTVADVDGIVTCDLETIRHNDLAQSLGLPELNYWGSTGVGGTAPCGMVAQAVAAITAGLARSVLVFRSLNGRSGPRYGRAAGARRAVGGADSLDEFTVPYGLVTAGQAWALIARRHMIDFGTTREQLGAIALACRARANTNPAAEMHARTMSMDDYLEARVIASPLGLFDYCQETDGACAVIVTSTERARHLAQPPALIRSVAQGASDDLQGAMFVPAVFRRDLTTHPSANVARTLWRRAGLGPDDVDVAQFYDCFTITVLVQLEDYGFCPKGEGGPFAASGAIEPGGSVPVNTAGGNLSEGYIHGLNHIVEGVRQIRGTSRSQVEGAEVSLVTSGLPPATSALVLTGDR